MRYEIESLTSQMKIYDKEVAYSTVSIFLEDVTEYSAKSSFGSRTWEAFTGGWNSFVSTVQSVIVALIWFLPFLVVGGAVVIIVVVCVKRSGRKKRAKFLADTENIAPEYAHCRAKFKQSARTSKEVIKSPLRNQSAGTFLAVCGLLEAWEKETLCKVKNTSI